MGELANTTVMGIPLTGLVIGGFMCGVALFYLVMQRQRRRNTENGEG